MILVEIVDAVEHKNGRFHEFGNGEGEVLRSTSIVPNFEAIVEVADLKMVITNGDFGDGVGGDDDGGTNGDEDDSDDEETTDDVGWGHDGLPSRETLLFEGCISGAFGARLGSH